MALSRLLVATTNRDKIREITRILAGGPHRILTLADWPSIEPAPETRPTFIENARDKALYYAAATGELTVAEDSGLEVDALDGAPGVVSARYGGTAISYPDRFNLIYERLRAKNVSDGTARFVCALVLAHGQRILFETTGVIEGRIAPEPQGTGGFGYDPIFLYPPAGRTLAELSEGEKTAVSHRGQAFRALRQFLEKVA